MECVLQTAGLQETDYLEWKTAYDLSKNPGAAATSKHLIGFANRDFAQALRHVDGHAYLLLGVEPGNLVGVPSWDSADIENWLTRFAGPELRYDVHYVDTGGKRVLFLTVDAPKQGDPIYCLQRASSELDGKSLPGGAVYVRRNGLTDFASAADIARLTARASAAVSELALRVELDSSLVAVISDQALSPDARNEWVEHERGRLYATMPPSRQRDPYGLSLPSFTPETRSREEFMAEVKAYADAIHRQWPGIVAVNHVRDEQSKLVAVLVNDTDHNFEEAVLELTLPFEANWVYTAPGDAAHALNPPKPPEGWGQGLLAAIRKPVVLPRVGADTKPELEALSNGAILARFPPIHVRPHTPHRLAPLFLALPPALAGQRPSAQWRATARNTPGQLAGTTELAIPELEGEDG